MALVTWVDAPAGGRDRHEPDRDQPTTQWIKRSAHRSVHDLVASIRTWIADWNDEPKPYVWHKSADEILDSLAAYCERINDSGH